MHHWLSVALFLASPAVASTAHTWHVSGSGNDAHAGTDSSASFRSLQHAAGLVEPGATVLIGNGVDLTPTNDVNGNVLTISRSGRATGALPTTFARQ